MGKCLINQVGREGWRTIKGIDADGKTGGSFQRSSTVIAGGDGDTQDTDIIRTGHTAKRLSEAIKHDPIAVGSCQTGDTGTVGEHGPGIAIDKKIIR